MKMGHIIVSTIGKCPGCSNLYYVQCHKEDLDAIYCSTHKVWFDINSSTTRYNKDCIKQETMVKEDSLRG